VEQVFNDDHEMIDFVQTLLGGSLIGLSIEHFLAILVGKGRNGKDTMLEAIRGDLWAWAGLSNSIRNSDEPGFRQIRFKPQRRLVALKGRRLVWDRNHQRSAN